MAFHINPATGNVGACTAKRQCPFGDMVKDHYATKADAMRAYERQQQAFPVKVSQAVMNAAFDRAAGRWCEHCQQNGSHHTDSHSEFARAALEKDENRRRGIFENREDEVFVLKTGAKHGGDVTFFRTGEEMKEIIENLIWEDKLTPEVQEELAKANNLTEMQAFLDRHEDIMENSPWVETVVAPKGEGPFYALRFEEDNEAEIYSFEDLKQAVIDNTDDVSAYALAQNATSVGELERALSYADYAMWIEDAHL